VVANDHHRVRVVVVEDRRDLLVDGFVDAFDDVPPVGMFVEHGVGLLELEESEIGVEPVGEIPERLATHPRQFPVAI
jgi:hypothetical protein